MGLDREERVKDLQLPGGGDSRHLLGHELPPLEATHVLDGRITEGQIETAARQ
jgi:hypothetical protein